MGGAHFAFLTRPIFELAEPCHGISMRRNGEIICKWMISPLAAPSPPPALP